MESNVVVERQKKLLLYKLFNCGDAVLKAASFLIVIAFTSSLAITEGGQKIHSFDFSLYVIQWTPLNVTTF